MFIFLADYRPVVRSALRLLLEQDPNTSVVNDIVDAEDLIAQAVMESPDLVLLDWGLPGLDDTDVLTTLRELCPDVYVIAFRCPDVYVIAFSGRPEDKTEAFQAGADDFVSKTEAPDRLLEAINNCWRLKMANPNGNLAVI
jgi:DNA-binding NarL/FixJ family response regulator